MGRSDSPELGRRVELPSLEVYEDAYGCWGYLIQALETEIRRLEEHIDAAFDRASSGDAHGARVELTKARWKS